jgi:hypothetical protein
MGASKRPFKSQFSGNVLGLVRPNLHATDYQEEVDNHQGQHYRRGVDF